MTRRTVLLVVAVALAGCAGGPGADVTTDGTTSSPADGNEGDLAAVPGVSAGELANASTLARANEAALTSSGGEVRIERTVDGRTHEFHLVTGREFSTYTLSGTRPAGDGETAAIELWSNETTRFVRSTADGEVSYRASERRHDRLNVLEAVGEYLAAGAFAVDEESSGDGTVVLRAEGNDPSADVGGPIADATDVEGKLVVTEAGLIRNLTVSGTGGGEPVTYRYELSRTGIASVDRPDWFGDVPESATLRPQLSVDVAEDTHLIVRNDGGDPVPAGVTISLTTNGTTDEATFENGIGAGETRYAYLDAADGGLVASGEPPAAGDAAPLSSPISVTVTTADGVDLYSASMGWASESAADGEGSATGSGGSSAGAGESDSGSATAVADG